MKPSKKKLYLQQRKRSLKKITGSIERPRLSVFRSNQHIYAQLINDEKGHTLVFASTLDSEIKNLCKSTSTQEAANLVGEKIGKVAKEKNINKIVFDRGNYPYHGRVKSVANGARKSGLEF